MHSIRLLALATALAFGACVAVSAQETQYFPPKLVKRAAPTVPARGKGKVVVQVELDAAGRVIATRVISSTNEADNAAALDIAKRSTYAPARRGTGEAEAKGEKGFYDFTLVFEAGGQAGKASPVDEAIGDINKNRFTAARDVLTPYLESNPADGKAQALLGIAQYYLKDYTASTTAFDRAGAAIPVTYKNLAADAYAHETQRRLAKGDDQAALVTARKAVALSPNPALYNLLGGVEIAAGDYKAAIGDIAKARDGAADAKLSANDRATIDVNLARAYANDGDAGSAQKYLAEAKQLNPKIETQGVLAAVYLVQAKAKLDAKDYAAAAKLYEQAGDGLSGKNAATAYTNAAFQYLTIARGQDPKTASATYDSAMTDANKALQAEPKFAAALYAQGAIYANQGKRDEAITALKQAGAAASAEGDAALASAIEKTLKQVEGGS